MDSQDKRNPISFISSLSYAISGVKIALRAERNMRIHFISSIFVLIGSFYFSITKIEWLFILFAISGMFALELVNTAIERVVDLMTEEYHPLAKQAKDLAAGAVLVYAVLSVAIGMIIFFPYILNLF
ncbi:diacylglycerol kinase family protein [Neobacillus vireti]|uniref:Diacylglycerol kinase n=1 Tax=Neobacillus vireti LMG 21834 TaxID=1131730 RepID=A0AB94IJ08_9BACI|nr:diacylglycerol kinase family protein [Neobacillus vireti]ETI67003.1 diacylglycerol kinase [Neobacillus vireti LMG 21834]KLT16956.1 diacylglycerol kinase [Neobacillus vireti]